MYDKPIKYTLQQELDCKIADIETEVNCAHRDNYPQYAEECEDQLRRLKLERKRLIEHGI